MNSDLLEVLDEFHDTLIEVEILIESAENDLEDSKRYTTYLKSALLLMSGKFENFIELISDTYVYQLNKNNLIASKIPEIIKLRHTYEVLEKIQKKKNSGSNEKDIIMMLNEVGSIWILSDQPFCKIQLDCKFSYGKHGEDELKKLFNIIGIKNVFDEVKVTIPDETDPSQTILIDFKGTFNSITGLRNNILHQNASPGLTHLDVKTNLQIVKSFSIALTDYLDAHLNMILS